MAFLERNSNRGSVATGFNIDNSLKLERGNSEKLSRTPSSASNSKKWTYSFWLKRTQLGINSYHLEAKGSGDRFFILGFNENDNLLIYDIYSDDYGKVLRMKFRDIAAWYHIVLAIDTTDGTAGNRNKFYVNGVLVTDYVTDYGDFPQNHDTQINKAVVHNIGYRTDINQYASGYQAETCLIDGAALAPTSFGEFDDSGIWKPIDVTELTFGTNGFYQEYESSSALGADTVPGGNSNDYAASNIAAADQATDTPTNNFCTINTPFDPYVGGPPTITEGATIMTAGSSGQQDSYGTMPLFKGKWYFEFSVLNVGGLAIANMFGGVVKVNRLLQSSYNNAANGHHSHDGGWGGGVNAVGVHSGSGSGFSAVSGAAVDVVVGVAVDMDNGKIWWASGGTYASSSGSVSNPVNGTLPQFSNLLTQYPGEPVVPAYNHYVHQATTKSAFNFGNPFDHAFTDIGTNSDANGYGSFAYTPPAGYYAICSKNLAEYG